jgi:hypothetical protein
MRSKALILSFLCAVTAQGQTLRGTVTDSVHKHPLIGATVIATPLGRTNDTLFHSGVSNARGEFFIAGLRPGRYSVSVEHPWIDSTGVVVPTQETTLPAAGETTIALAVPSVSTLRHAFCPAVESDPTLGVVMGTVRYTDGRAARGSSVVFSWSDFDVDRANATVKNRQLGARATTDSLGVYRACGVPIMRSLFVQAQGNDVQSGVLEEKVSDAAVLVRDFVVEPGHAAVSDSAPLGRYLLTGKVTTSNNQPIANAQVRLFGTQRAASTNGAGDFRLGGLPGGTQGVEIVALGFYPRRITIVVSENSTPLTIALDRAAAVLDSFKTVAKRVSGRNAIFYREFEQRMLSGQGHYITEDMIAERHAQLLTDVVANVPGFKIVYGRDLRPRLAAARGRGTIGNTECEPDLFIDGVKVPVEEINSILPASVHGMELYTVATAPAKYHVSNCGAVFLWTK